MAIEFTKGKIHWNYFLALERDLEDVSRYIEFVDAEPNMAAYSIELAHLLFAAASEVDVVAKLLCEILSPGAQHMNINDYRAVLPTKLPTLCTTKVSIPRYNITLVAPWTNWLGTSNPDWWESYNNVKHHRDTHFGEATLRNALNALGALLILTYHYYSYSLSPTAGQPLAAKETTRKLEPQSTLLRLSEDHYYDPVVT